MLVNRIYMIPRSGRNSLPAARPERWGGIAPRCSPARPAMPASRSNSACLSGVRLSPGTTSQMEKGPVGTLSHLTGAPGEITGAAARHRCLGRLRRPRLELRLSVGSSNLSRCNEPNEKGAPMGPLFRLTGAPGEIRTPDLLVRSQTLYPTELRARFLKLYSNYGGEGGMIGRLRRLVPCAGSAGSGSNPVFTLRGSESPREFISNYGGEGGIRTLEGAINPLLP